jgi:hypothetical protein
MPWHLSKSDPRKVYDERHQVVCVCQTAEQAERIVNAVAGQPSQPQQTKLREPEPPKPVHTHQAEGCCAKALGKASLSGVLDNLQPFECPKCSTTYWPKVQGPVTVWEARADVMVFRP